MMLAKTRRIVLGLAGIGSIACGAATGVQAAPQYPCYASPYYYYPPTGGGGSGSGGSRGDRVSLASPYYPSNSSYDYSSQYGACATGSQVSGATGVAAIRAIRQFNEALVDRNQDTIASGATAGDNSVPTFVAQYAPSDYLALAKSSPIIVKSAPVAPKYRIYGTGFGGGFNSTGTPGAAETGSYYGGLIGLDYQVTSNFLVGAAAGGSDSRVNIGALNSNGRVAGFNGSIYGIYSLGQFYGQSLTTFSAFTNDTTRNVAVVGGTAVQKASFGSTEIRTRAEIGRVFALGDAYGIPNLKIVPFIALEIANLHQNGFAEFNANGLGNGAGITSNGQDIADVPGFIGARFESSIAMGNGMIFRPILRLAYVHQFATAPVVQTALIATPAANFAANTTLLGRDSALTKAGFELDTGKGAVMFANFDGLFSGTDKLYGGRGGVRYSF